MKKINDISMNFLLFINPWLLIIINKSIYAMRGIDG